MPEESAETPSGIGALARRLSRARDGRRLQTGQGELAARERTVLVAKVRWLLLAAFGIYGGFAGSFYYFSPYGLFLSRWQEICLFVSLATVVTYNTAFHLFYDWVRHLRCLEQLQIILDLLFVTVLIHFSGGAASWFWAVYLIVTIEAAFLLDRTLEVWLLGSLGALLYGALLAAEYGNLLTYVRMPFVDLSLHHDALYLALNWLWVGLLNATVSILAAVLMSALRRQTEAVRTSEERLSGFLDSANDLIFSFSADGRLRYANQMWRRTLGFGPEDLPGLNILDLVHRDFRSKCLVELRKALTGSKSNPIEGRLIGHGGRQVEVEGNLTCSHRRGEEAVIWGICRDITERKQAQAQLYHLAHHDLLTGLPNRLFFIDRLRQARALAKRFGQLVAVLFLDLDRFKIVNDTLGHSVGDEMLQQTAQRLTACVRESDTVARLGGDEFTVILGNLSSAEAAEKIAGKLLKALAQPLCIDGRELFTTASIGVSLYPQDGDDPVTLIKKADIAMYQAKARGRNNFQFYVPAMDLDAERRLAMENGMRRALERQEYVLHYQPKVDVASGRITALEALLRWQHPELGLLPPSEFIPLAEETGLIIELGAWALREACAQNRAWQDAGLPRVRVAVNLSGDQLQQQNFTATVARILEETGLQPRYLELEITETVIMRNPDFAAEILGELRSLGVHLAIDDFGTGYSSLSHLKRFAVNTLKIDKIFVRDIESSSTDAAITTAIIAMGNNLSLRIVAEGVETEGQLSFLRKQRCHEIQGFLFSRPLPAAGAGEFMRRMAEPVPEVPCVEGSVILAGEA